MKNVFIYPVLLIRDHGRVRTCNPQSRNLIFYPVELRSQYNVRLLINEFRFKNVNQQSISFSLSQ